MALHPARLFMVCGKIAAGKSTLAAKLSQDHGAVLISEDACLGPLFADLMQTGADYLNYSERLRAVMAPHVADLLQKGVSVVLDFPANTKDQRNWMRALLDETGADHELHLLDVPDAVCLDRLRDRNKTGEHPFAVTDEQFRAFSKHFDKPSADEGFHVIAHST